MLPTGMKHPPTKKTPLSKRISAYRDAGVVLAGSAYALGFAARALHAYLNNLGSLPGARFEYLVSGVVLLILPAGLGLSVIILRTYAIRLAEWTEKGGKRADQTVQTITLSLLLSLALMIICWSTMLGTPVMILFAAVTLFCGLYFSNVQINESKSATSPNAQTPKSKEWRLAAKVGNLLLHLWGMLISINIAIMVLLLFLLAAWYGASALTRIPQELGGIQAKCGILDLVVDELSLELRALVIEPATLINPLAKIVRSKPMKVFATSGPWLVRVRDPLSSAHTRSLRIDSNAVRSVEWCR